MGKIWFDVGLVKSWKGELGGVLRCEAQIAAAFLKEHSEKIVFAYWDERNELVEWEAHEVRIQLERMGVLIPSPPLESQPVITFWPTEQVFKYLGVFNAILCRQLKRIAVFLIGQGILDLLCKLLFKREDFTRKGLKSEPPLQITENDVYVSVGASWVIDRFNYLFHLKKEHQFKSVLLCHDLIPVRFPNLTLEWTARIFPYYLCNLAWCADVILCNSKTTERDLLQFIDDSGSPLPKHQVVHFGNQIQDQTNDALSEFIRALIDTHFILYVSTIEVRKNHEVLCLAYLELLRQGYTNLPRLVFVGSWGWGVEGLRENIELHPQLSQWVVVLEGLGDAEVSALYQACLFTVYPSFYEGWGLPVAESLAFGKWCLASFAPSLKEIGGELIDYIDSSDTKLWAKKIAWYVQHPEVLAQKEQAIRRTFKSHSWSQTADEILSISLAQIES